MSWFSKWLKWGTFVLAILGFVRLTMILQEIKAQQVDELPPPPVTPPVKTYESTVAATGIVEALGENVSIGVPVAGLVIEMLVKVNDVVEEGQPLFRLDDRDLKAQWISVKSTVEVSAAKIAVQRANVLRVKDLLTRIRQVTDRRAVSVDEVKVREMDVAIGQAQLMASEAEYKAALAQVEQLELLMDRLVVKAPRSGTILQVNVRAGEYASFAPRSPALVLGDLSEYQIRADVDELNATRVQQGRSAKAYIKGGTQQAIELTFVRIEPYVIPKVSLTGASTERVDTRVLQVIYRFKKPADLKVYVGQQVDVYIDAEPAS